MRRGGAPLTAPNGRGTYGRTHICCRPLDVRAVLERLAHDGAAFRIDFFLPSAPDMMRAAAPWLCRASTVLVNAAGHRVLQSVTGVAALPEIVVTDGPRAAQLWMSGEQAASAVPPTNPPNEATGVGDTLTGTFLALRSKGVPPAQALDRATTAAARRVCAPPLPVPAQRRA
ncbi:hypothetical protein KUM39_20320 [Streptomyces sp. J2-1]|uniref:hypothetical protein n=1 Tax=Streptomyces corallincola TaxID=2851888 RepID=UPI001C390AF7|nr:hypothetical protein [Streptomyces corallincola]MBV2356691.1 hypothetical protein [Streptomyces corallincola]